MKRNSGQFKKGHDARRHRFTKEEQRRGYRTLMDGGRNDITPGQMAWAYRKVRSYYRTGPGR